MMVSLSLLPVGCRCREFISLLLPQGEHLCRTYTNRNLLPLKGRGLISDIFPDNQKTLVDACNSGPQVMYAGFDPTAESLHVGNLAVIMVLLQAQRAGHSPIVVVSTHS